MSRLFRVTKVTQDEVHFLVQIEDGTHYSAHIDWHRGSCGHPVVDMESLVSIYDLELESDRDEIYAAVVDKMDEMEEEEEEDGA
jgi:hypothetical protein